MNATTTSTPQVRLSAVALPAEHGGWGFLLEPILLGLLVAPSAAGFFLGTAAFGAFLLRQPLKIALVDRRRGRRYRRTAYAERFALLYAGITLLAGVVAVGDAGWSILLPLLIAAPFGVLQLIYDARGDSRHWLPEMAGPAALAAVASSIAVAGGWPPAPALALWVIVIARALPSILYARARLRLEKGKPMRAAPVMVASALAVVTVIALILADLAPWLSALAMLVLLARAAYGLSKYRRPAAAKVIGFQEIGFGLLTVILVAVGYAF